jgi:VanZ family protein
MLRFLLYLLLGILNWVLAPLKNLLTWLFLAIVYVVGLFIGDVDEHAESNAWF